MATPLPAEQIASYSAIIDGILNSSDLNTISAKKIRKGLQEAVDYDLTPQRQPITDLIMERFDKVQAKADVKPAGAIPEPAPTANGTALKPVPNKKEHANASKSTPAPAPTSSTKRKASPEDSDSLSELADTPPPKKAKKSKPVKSEEIEDDAKIAARLQAELNAPAGRATRGGAKQRKAPVKKAKAAKKKSKAVIKPEDDSEVEAGDSEGKPEREKKGAFHKFLLLSEPLAALLSEPALSRPQTVKLIWRYVKARSLQDPADKRQIVCDARMRAVFKSDKVHMFTMNKILAQHLYPMEEPAEAEAKAKYEARMNEEAEREAERRAEEKEEEESGDRDGEVEREGGVKVEGEGDVDGKAQQ